MAVIYRLVPLCVCRSTLVGSDPTGWLACPGTGEARDRWLTMNWGLHFFVAAEAPDFEVFYGAVASSY